MAEFVKTIFVFLFSLTLGTRYFLTSNITSRGRGHGQPKTVTSRVYPYLYSKTTHGRVFLETERRAKIIVKFGKSKFLSTILL